MHPESRSHVCCSWFIVSILLYGFHTHSGSNNCVCFFSIFPTLHLFALFVEYPGFQSVLTIFDLYHSPTPPVCILYDTDWIKTRTYYFSIFGASPPIYMPCNVWKQRSQTNTKKDNAIQHPPFKTCRKNISNMGNIFATSFTMIQRCKRGTPAWCFSSNV